MILMLGLSDPGRADIIEKLLMPGEVIEGHAEYEEDCAQCHESFEKGAQRNLCLDCHEDVATDFKEQIGYHGRLPNADTVACETCHTEHKGPDADIVQFNASTFDHTQTDFELLDKHQSVTCESCHKPDKKFRDALSQCIDCHEDDDNHMGNLGESCEDCHSEKGWQEVRFDHDETDFPLEGAHQETNCASCHPDEQYEQISTLCVSCHLVNDTHGGTRGNACEDCHTTEAWDENRFDHDKDTDFKLEGSHADVTCNSCHKDPVYDKAPPKTCIGCHENDDRHNGRNGESCDDCHNSQKWSEIAFDHDKETDFPLKGKHAKTTCGSCHKGELEDAPDTTCITCHRGEDVHAGQLGEQCEQCHNETSFTDKLRFDHDITNFPLIGQHAITSCDECHQEQTFKDTSLKCVSCHKDDDQHKGALGPDCASCHTPNDWALWQFDHDTQTDFALDGKHEGLSCDACHTKSTEKVERQSSCYSCHRTDDVHFGGFGRNCERCHTTDSFSDTRKMSR